MKWISWNVNGLRACLQKGFSEFVQSEQPDVLALQEIKMQPHQAEVSLDGYRMIWNSAERNGYSGTAVFTKKEPDEVRFGIGLLELDAEGRCITLLFPNVSFVTVYTPNAQDGLKRLSTRMLWDDAFRAYVSELKKERTVIVCGDMNVAHREIDLKNPAANRQSAGFSGEERAKFGELLDAGFIDTFRHLYPDRRDAYSWWSYRFGARTRNAGWRIDYFLISDESIGIVKDHILYTNVMGSDHCPVGLITEALWND